ncbi:MAG: type II CAAX endopeptidase family protein [Ignavibacteriaceae bacterium]|nr:type II CAAX endopeptidase family protein [Ignavibacteriaceae bacterium]
MNENINLKFGSLTQAIKSIILLLLLIYGLMFILSYPAQLLNASGYVMPVSHTLALFIFILILKPGTGKIAGLFSRKIPFMIYVLSTVISVVILSIEFPLLVKLPVINDGMKTLNGFNIVSIIIYGIVLIPVLEETIFRGLILGDFLLAYSPAKAILLSSALFACIHPNPSQIINAFIIGLFLGWIFYKTGSILPGILVHAILNSSSGILFKYLSSNAVYFKGNGITYIIMYAICLCILFIALIAINKRVLRLN